MHKDIAQIRRSRAVFVPADKTRNLYELEKEQYDELLQESITKHYKVADEDAYDDINTEAQIIAHRLCLSKRMDAVAKREAF